MKLTAIDKKLQNYVVRFLMVDNQQTTFNKITQKILDKTITFQGKLLDDFHTFEKLLNLQWDVIIFNAAYDFTYEQAIQTVREKGKKTPILLINEIDSTSNNALKILQKGIYNIVNSENIEHLSLTLYRASIYSRLVRREQQLSLEIDKLEQQTQTLVETTEQAVAIFQEGIHISVNEQYLNLFDEKDNQEFLGLPILDILQPQDTLEFKQYFKRVSKGDFSQPTLSIYSQNPNIKEKNLTLQFSNIQYENEPALQLIILIDNENTSLHYPNQNNVFADPQEIYNLLNFSFAQNSRLGCILFIVEQVPTNLVQQNWNSVHLYFDVLAKQLSTLAQHELLRITENIFLTTHPVINATGLQQYIQCLQQQFPTSINIQRQNFPVYLQVSALFLENLPKLEQIPQLLNQAFAEKSIQTNTIAIEQEKVSIANEAITELKIATVVEPVKQDQDIVDENTINFSFGEVIVEPANSENSSINNDVVIEGSKQALIQQIDNNTVKLYFQQLYDKEDIDTHLFEITATFRHQNQIIAVEDYEELQSDFELSTKIDRWILVEASKRLHQFLTTCPKARIIVNLHIASLNDPTILPLLSKLVNLINSKYTRPLILQFKEADILTDLDITAKFIQSIQEQNIGITISNFGQSIYSINILQKLKIKFAKLAPEFSQKLLSDDELVELQEKLDSFKEHNDEIQFLINQLDDMTLFANSWNIEARYLQGDYFQARQENFVDSTN